jgi:hypothetical protein
MSTLINYNVNVNQLKEHANEKGFVSITLSVNDQATEWGDNVSSWVAQSLEERDAQKPRKYLRGGRTIWSSIQEMFIPKKQQND